MTLPEDLKPEGSRERRIEGDIEQTRSAISEKLEAIGEKLSPENLKQEARNMVGEAKEAAVDKLREVKADAYESVSETAREVGERARRAGEVTFDFARSNAVPLGLIGLGIGLLIARSGSRRPRYEAMRWPEDEPLRGYTGYGEDLEFERGARQRAADAGARVKGAMDRTRERAEQLSSRAKSELEENYAQVSRRARDFGRRAQRRFERTERSAVELARDNPLAVGAGAMAAGMAVGLLLPATRPESELLGPTRDRLVGEVRGSIEGAGRTAKEAARDVQNALRPEPQR